MTIEIRFYYSEATRVNQPKQTNEDSMSCCSIERSELFNTNIIKFIVKEISTIIEQCLNEICSIEIEPIFMKNLKNYDHHHGYRLVIDIESSVNKVNRIWHIVILFFNQVLDILSPANYIPASIINIDFNKGDQEVIKKYIPNIFNKKLGQPLTHPIKVKLVGNDEILEVAKRWGENQEPCQPEWAEIITFEGRFKRISFNHTFIITISGFGDIEIHNEEYRDNEILDLAKEYNGDIYTQTNINNTIKVTVNKLFNELDNKSEYRYKSAEIIPEPNDTRHEGDNITQPIDFNRTDD